MKRKKFLSLILALVMTSGVMPVAIADETAPAEDALVYLTVSNQGVIAKANDGSIMANKEVVVSDINEDGKLTFDEALVAAHKTYNSEDGYVARSGYVAKLWSETTGNCLFFTNNVGLTTGVTVDEVKEGDFLVASVNQDNKYYADWYTFFDKKEVEVTANEEFTLNLKGRLGMAYKEEDFLDVALENIEIGIWEDGEFKEIEGKKTDENGKVTLCFDKPGTYFVTADGTVADEVTDWFYNKTLTVDCPIIAPVCKVNVSIEPELVYLTISNQGIIAKANDGSIMANREVMVSDINGDGKLSFDEALVAAHKTYNSEDGYVARSGYVAKLWSETTGNCLFFTNNVGLTTGVTVDEVKEGDFLVASVNQDNKYYADWYTFFDKKEVEVTANEEFTLNLKGRLGMAYKEEDFLDVALENIEIGIWEDGEFKEIEGKKTDENGKVTLCFDKPGTYFVTADGTVADEVTDWFYNKTLTVDCPIIAPVCKVNVTPSDEVTIIENIIDTYKNTGVCEDGNIEWLLADFAAYEILNPEKTVLTKEQKQDALDKIIENVSGSLDKPGNLAKAIIALRGMGYDARKVFTKDEEEIDLVEKLTSLIDDENSGVTNVYTLPYVLIALQQGEDYIDEDKENFLIESAIANKAFWTEYGVDGATMMILALAPYIENEEVKTALDEAVSDIHEAQSESGAILTYGSDSAASTGCAIAALSALGINSAEVIKNDNSLIDGLMSLASEGFNGFEPMSNTFSTEQGLRGLLSWQLLEQEENTRIYDFSENPMNEARASVEEGDDNISDGGITEGKEKITVYFTLLGDEEHEEPKKNKDKHTLKKGNLKEWIPKTKVSLYEDLTVIELIEKVLKEHKIDYKNENGYISEIDGLAEFDNGELSGWMYTLNGEYSKKSISEQVLEDGDIVVLHYTDDYNSEIKEDDDDDNKSGNSSGNKTGSTKVNNNAVPAIVQQNNTLTFDFMDVKDSDWYYEAVKYVNDKKLMNGTDKGFEPNKEMTRAMLVTVLYRLDGSVLVDGENRFSDVVPGSWYEDAVIWASENAIVNGIGEEEFAPDMSVTREQMTAIIYRYAEFKGKSVEEKADLSEFSDYSEVSEWAVDAFAWANKASLINGVGKKNLAPKATATRAQVATILMRYVKLF